jgi:hypothetical protein
MMKKWSINISKYFFLLLFLGFFGSITLFDHAHIVDGTTIVHSHPYKTNSHSIPLHSHSEKGYITIQLLSFLAYTFLFICFNFKTIPPLVGKIVLKIKEGMTYHLIHYLYLLRAPPAGMPG